jgi:hypothetical protein
MSLPIEDGIDPRKSHTLIFKLFKFVRLPIADGIGPLNVERKISKLVKYTRSPNVDSAGLVKLQLEITRLLKLLSLATEEKDVRDKLHPESFKLRILSMSPIQDKIGPKSLADSI